MKGTYLVLARLAKATTIQVGRLAKGTFPAGWYLYVGSAMGPGGVRARLARHGRQEKRLHWHIDYLLAHCVPAASWYVASTERLECAWARALVQLDAAHIPMPGFGSSDCHCASHLFYFSRRPSLSQIEQAIDAKLVLFRK